MDQKISKIRKVAESIELALEQRRQQQPSEPDARRLDAVLQQFEARRQSLDNSMTKLVMALQREGEEQREKENKPSMNPRKRKKLASGMFPPPTPLLALIIVSISPWL